MNDKNLDAFLFPEAAMVHDPEKILEMYHTVLQEPIAPDSAYSMATLLKTLYPTEGTIVGTQGYMVEKPWAEAASAFVRGLEYARYAKGKEKYRKKKEIFEKARWEKEYHLNRIRNEQKRTEETKNAILDATKNFRQFLTDDQKTRFSQILNKDFVSDDDYNFVINVINNAVGQASEKRRKEEKVQRFLSEYDYKVKSLPDLLKPKFIAETQGYLGKLQRGELPTPEDIAFFNEIYKDYAKREIKKQREITPEQRVNAKTAVMNATVKMLEQGYPINSIKTSLKNIYKGVLSDQEIDSIINSAYTGMTGGTAAPVEKTSPTKKTSPPKATTSRPEQMAREFYERYPNLTWHEAVDYFVNKGFDKKIAEKVADIYKTVQKEKQQPKETKKEKEPKEWQGYYYRMF